jgi:hypothetical protein
MSRGQTPQTGIDYSDWVLRLCSARANGNGRPYGEGVDVRPAEDALREALTNGSVHESLVEEPAA